MHDELADVDRREAVRDAVEHDVQSVAGRQHGVHERGRDIEPASGRREHALDQVAHLVGAEDRGRELVLAVARDEDPVRLVDPDLLDGRVVEVRLQRAEAGQPGDQLVNRCVRVVERSDSTAETARVVLLDGCASQRANPLDLCGGIDSLAPHMVPDLRVEPVDRP